MALMHGNKIIFVTALHFTENGILPSVGVQIIKMYPRFPLWNIVINQYNFFFVWGN